MDLNNPEQIKQIIAMLQNLVDQNSEDSDEPESKIKTKTVRAGNKKKTKNKFVDMPEKNMHKDDIAIDKKLAVTGPTPRTRKFQPVKVSCRICGKSESVSADVIPESVERYKCNKCAAMAGG
jgi:hypothetical protein